MIGGFSDSSRVMLRYTTTVSMNVSGSGVTGNFYNFRGNSVFDPDQTSTGLQPSNYDEWSLMYQCYRVWGSKITVRPSTTTTGAQAMLVVCPSRSAYTGTTLLQAENLQTNAYSRSWQIGFNSTQFRPEGYKNHMSTCKIYASTPQAFMGKDSLAAVYTANPEAMWYWNIAYYNPNQDQNITTSLSIVIDYDVEFYERIVTTLDMKHLRIQHLIEETRQRVINRERDPLHAGLERYDDTKTRHQPMSDSSASDVKFKVLFPEHKFKSDGLDLHPRCEFKTSDGVMNADGVNVRPRTREEMLGEDPGRGPPLYSDEEAKRFSQSLKVGVATVSEDGELVNPEC